LFPGETPICAEVLLFSIGAELWLFSNHRPSYPQNFFKNNLQKASKSTLFVRKVGEKFRGENWTPL
jgi:hypothetical protein